MKHVILFILLCTVYIVNAQRSASIGFASDSVITSKINEDTVTVIEFWASWNAYNQCSYLKNLNNCNAYRVDVDDSYKLVRQYNIRVIPTVLIFNDGILHRRYEANLMFKAYGNFCHEGIQKTIDSLNLKK